MLTILHMKHLKRWRLDPVTIICRWVKNYPHYRHMFCSWLYWRLTSVKHGEGTGRQFTSITNADNAHTVENLKKLNFEVLEHPYIVLTLHLHTHLFGPLKQALRGRRFTTDQQLDVTVHARLVSQLKTFYSEVIKQIVRWWTKCIVKQGDCVEKLCSCKISALVSLNMKHTVRIIIDSPSYFKYLTEIHCKVWIRLDGL
jgi:hypothetical protein